MTRELKNIITTNQQDIVHALNFTLKLILALNLSEK